MIALPLWAFPLIFTLALFGLAIFWPIRKRQGDYDFPEFAYFSRFAAAIIGSLAAWLVWALET